MENKLLTALKNTPQKIDAEKDTNKLSMEAITLNPIFPEELLTSDVLFGKLEAPDAAGFALSSLSVASLEADVTSTLGPSEIPTVDKYYSKRMESVRKLFSFFQRKLSEDLKSKKKAIVTNGISFDAHLRMIERIPTEIDDAFRKRYPDIHLILAQSGLKMKYQTTLATDVFGMLAGVYLFVPYEDEEIPGAYYAARLFLSLKDISENSGLRAKFFNFAEYMRELDNIANLGKEDLARAENLINCNTAATGVRGYPELLEYVNFSKRFHQPKPITITEDKKEASKKRANSPVRSNSFLDAIDSGYHSILEAASSAMYDLYTVTKHDKMIIVGGTYELASVPAANDLDTVPSPLLLRSKKFLDHTRTSTDPENPFAKAEKTVINPAQSIVELNQAHDEGFPQKLAESFEKTGNALKEGQEIKIPKATFKFDAEIGSGGNIAPIAKSIWNGFEVESLDPAVMSDIWNEAFLDPLLLKICPATLPLRVMECLLPGNCRELITYIGLWRTRDILEKFIILDMFTDKNGLTEALTKWDQLVESNYNFKAVKFDGNGLLKSGQFDAKDMFTEGTGNLSVSFQLRTKSQDIEINSGKTKVIMSQSGVFELKKTSSDKIRITINSQSGQEKSYETKDSFFKDDLWHQAGFVYAAGSGNFTFYYDGTEVDTELYSGQPFTGPIATPQTTRVVLASENHQKSQKGFAGEIDEVCFFEKILTTDEWRKLGKIDSDVNLATIGLKTYARAWWRMGDAENDIIPNDGTGNISDLIGQKDLSPIGPVGSMEIIVVRLFKQKDENRFIDIVARETDFERLCSLIVNYIKEQVEVFGDPERMKRDILEQIRIPNFQSDPHKQVKLVIKKTIVEQLLKLVATFLLQMIETLLGSCDSWRDMTKALVNGSFAWDGPTLASAFGENNPIAEFINATQDPNQWAEILTDTESYFIDGVTTALSTGFQMHESGSDGQQKYTTLGIGQVQFAEEHIADAQVFGTMNGTEASIQNYEGTNSQNVVINLVKKATQDLPPESMLSLLASDPDPGTLSNVTEIINAGSDELGMTLSEDDTRMFFGTIGSGLGFQGIIDQLRYAAQLVNNASADPEFCLPSQNISERLGIKKSPSQKASDQATVQDILDKSEKIQEGSKDQCAIPIPMTPSEEQSLRRTITDVFSPIVAAYDRDLILYKLGLTSMSTKKREIKKVLWKGDEERVKTADESGNIKLENIKIEKTVINPEFEGMLQQGFVPLKEDGTPDGTRFGGVVKINWNILDLFKEEGGFLSEIRPPKSLSPKVEGDTVTDPDVEIKDIGASLGPYTDYEDHPGGNIAHVPTTRIKLGGNATEPLSAGMRNFLLEDSRGDDEASYFARRANSSKRGIKNIPTKSRTSLIAPPVTNPQNENSKVPDSWSTVTHETPYGKSLQGEKLVSFDKKGSDEFSLDPLPVPFGLDAATMESILSMGYDPGPEECDVLSAAVNSGRGRSEDTKHTPQENVFYSVVEKMGRPRGLGPRSIKEGAYNSLYREVMTALLFHVADSPLLREVPGVVDSEGDPMAAINFLKLDTNPRLIDMASFATQVSEDYSNLMSCPDNLTEPPLYTALKTAAPRILARVYIVDIALRAIVPFSQLFFSPKDKVIQGLIMRRIERDITTFAPNDLNDIKAKIVDQYNALASTGQIDYPTAPEGEEFETEGFEMAMRYFIEDEFSFVTDRLKEIVHGGCIPNSEENKDSIKKEMYQTIMRYADMKDTDLKFETYAVTKEVTRVIGTTVATEEAEAQEITETIPSEIIKEFSIRRQHAEIESIGTSLSYFYRGKEIVLAKVEQNLEELLKELGIDFNNIECDNSAIYDANGTTTPTDTHYHTYSVRPDGSGATTSTIGDHEPHTHAIHSYAIVPKFKEDGTIGHVHTLVPRLEQDAIDEASVMSRVQGAMRDKLSETDSFRVVFDFCFDLNDAASLVMMYCLQSSDDQIMSRVFNSTKKNVITMFGWLWEKNQAEDPCAVKESEAMALDFADMFPDMANAFFNPELLLMLLLAPLTTFKGWSKTADPHVFITSTIVELLGLPILPKNIKKNIPNVNPLDPKFGELECRNWPDFSQAVSPLDTLFAGGDNLFNPVGPPIDMPPLYIPAPVVEGAVAAGVTYAPLIVGLPPFPPTPYGMIYYFAVSPLIWLLRDLPRLIEMIQESESGRRTLAAAGLAYDDSAALSCDDLSPAEAIEAGATTTVEEEEGCPPVKNLQETIIETGQAKEC